MPTYNIAISSRKTAPVLNFILGIYVNNNKKKKLY